MKILILESNPRKDLQLNKEIRDLEGVVKRSRNRDQFEVKIGLAVGRDDLQELLLDYGRRSSIFVGMGRVSRAWCCKRLRGRSSSFRLGRFRVYLSCFGGTAPV